MKLCFCAIMGKSMVKSETENVMEAEIGRLVRAFGVFVVIRNLLGVSGIAAAVCMSGRQHK